jgi:flavin-dependent dehydrogenase
LVPAIDPQLNPRESNMKTTLALLLAGAAATCLAQPAFIKETAKEIPLAYDVDVLVMGGSSAAVAAAEAAAEAGASVFLAAEQMYLGDDIAGTLRLALEDGEDPSAHPLASTIWKAGARPDALPFKYTSSRPSVGMHQDTAPPSMLSDGVYERADRQSVEFSGPVSLTVDLGSSSTLTEISVMVFRREGVFDLGSGAVYGSTDGSRWNLISELSTPEPYREDQAHTYSVSCDGTFRHLRFDLAPPAGLKRLLLGEIVLTGVPGSASQLSAQTPTPLHVKQVLDNALIESGVKFLFGCNPAEVLIDERGDIAGAVLVNRAGRQAVRAKTVIDATPRGTLARQLGAEFTACPPGKQRFSFGVIAKEVNQGSGITAVQTVPAPDWDPRIQKITAIDGKDYPAGPPAGFDNMFRRYELEIEMNDTSFAAFANAEQVARDLTFNPTQIETADLLFQVPADAMKGLATAARWDGANQLDLNTLKTSASKHFFLLGGCASVARPAAEKLLRPVDFMTVGERVGRTAAADAKARGPLAGVSMKAISGEAAALGELRESLTGIRPSRIAATRRIHSGESALPVWGEFDVVVVGGGTAGAPAAISAVRQGARTLLLERFHGLGGVATLGRIGVYCDGYRTGFTQEMDDALRACGEGAISRTYKNWPAWNNQWKQQWYRSEFRELGGTLWFGASGCGALVDGSTVKGVIVSTPEGRGIVLAKSVVDATGNSDIATAVGADTIFVDTENDALQGTGLAVQNPYVVTGEKHPDYANSDWTFMDENDLIDTWRLHVGARRRLKEHFDVASLTDTRERRRIVGEYTIQPTDILAERVYPDTIAQAYSAFDTHGFTIHPVWYIMPPVENHVKYHADVPYRALLPPRLDGLIVCGIGISAQRDAMPVLRMQPDVQNTGYAAGLAAATSARTGTPLRHIDIRTLQAHLIEKGCLPDSVLTNRNPFPLPEAELNQLAASPLQDHKTLSTLLIEWERARPLLRQQYAGINDPDKKTDLALLLGMMGDDAGVEQLLAEVARRPWDAGWNFKAGGQFGGNMSELDRLILALGRTRDARAVPLLIEKMEQLTTASEFSHIRTVTLAAEALEDPRLAPGLHRLLQLEGVQGWTITSDQIIGKEDPACFTDRASTLRELLLARALYCCGDIDGGAEQILKTFTRDVRGYYALQAEDALMNK